VDVMDQSAHPEVVHHFGGATGIVMVEKFKN
jgi:hypothetical protein